MELVVSFAIPLVFLLGVDYAESKNGRSVLSRNKRYVVFPEGSSLSIAICMTAQTYIPTQIFTEAVNWGLAYHLPNDTSSFKDYIHPKKVMQRRHRRDLYRKMEIVMDSMGFDGRSCVFRALCESSRKLFSKGGTVVEEVLRIVFDFPLQKLLHSEPEEHRLYHWASRIGQDPSKECSDMFPSCSFSLIDMALGNYLNNLHDMLNGS